MTHEDDNSNRNTEPQQDSNVESASVFKSITLRTDMTSIVLEKDVWKKTVNLAATAVAKHDEEQFLDKAFLSACKFEVHGKVVFYDERSLFCLHSSYTIRKKLVWLVEWKWFENFVTAIILANSVTLALNDYHDRLEENYQSKRNAILDKLDQVFTAIFLVECFCKITAMGFILHKKAYLRELWNWLDFFVVSISIIALIPGIETNSSLKAIRTFRIVRPLRSINAMPRMRSLI